MLVVLESLPLSNILSIIAYSPLRT